MDSTYFFAGIKKAKKEDKNLFMQAQKDAKAKREQAKLEEKSALKIQALYRSFKTRAKLLNELSADRLKKFGDVLKLKGKLPNQQFSLIANKLLQYKGLLNMVVFLKPSNAKGYSELVVTIGDLLLSSLETEDAVFLNILNKNKETRIQWYVKLKHILLCLLEISYPAKGSMQIDNSNEQLIAENVLKKIMKINNKEWEVLDKALVKNPGLNLSLRKDIKNSLMAAISSKTLKNILASAQFKQSTFLRKFMLKTVVERTDISSRDLFVELLGLQSFYDDLTKMNEQKRSKLLKFLIRQLEEDKDLQSIEFETLRKFIADLIEFLSFALRNGILKAFDANFFSHIFHTLSRQIESYNNAIITIATSKKIISTAMEFEDEEEKKEDPIAETEQNKSSKQLKEIFEKDPSLTLSLGQTSVQHFCEFISGAFSQFSANDFEVFSNIVAKGCETLLLFLKSIKPTDKNACNNFLSFKLNFYYIPFMCLKRQGYNIRSMLFLPEKYIPIIKVFSKVLCHTLRITDDEEFIGNNEIVQSNWLLLNKEELIEIAGFSNQLLYNIIWDRMTSFYPVISAQVKLVRELHNRDGRIKFCPKDFWTIPELVKSVEQMLQNTDQLKMTALQDILNEVPHMLSFETRLNILHRFIERDKLGYDRFPGFDEYDNEIPRDPKTVTIRRDYLLEDGFEKISSRKDMRSIFMIQFINEHGMAEEGIDGGGLLKEFITLLNKEVFDIKYGLFIENEDKTLMPSPNSDLNPDHLKLFNFIGRMTGKAIYEHILIDSMFSVIFLNRILRIPNTINELKYADPMLYKNLMLLKHKNDVAEKLGLTFSIDEMVFGKQQTHLLKPNGDKIDVNESNKLEYISLYCNYKLNKQIDRQSMAFLDGLRSTIDLTWIRLFNHEELQYVISGLRRKGFDVADLKQNIEYGGFQANSPTILALWEVIEEMNDEERSLFLLFITGCSRPPTLGFKSMNPKIAIKNSSHGNNDRERLPTASTCANLFKLPDYKSKELLKKKLLYAINANAGFDFG